MKAFLTEKSHLLWPDVESDRGHYEELKAGDYQAWKRLPLAQTSPRDVTRRNQRIRTMLGSPTPAFGPPRGAVLVRRFPLHNWIVGQYELTRPVRLDYGQVYTMARRFFHKTPRDLLVFFEHPGR